jgi:hypothetical protein
MRAAARVLVPLLLAGSAFAGERNPPQIDYMLQCQGCHREDGTGAPDQGVPSLKDSIARFVAVPGGREYLVRVPGASSSPLSDAELAAVLNWMIVSYGPAEQAEGFDPYTEEEVAAVRRPPLARVYELRQSLLERFEAESRQTAN